MQSLATGSPRGFDAWMQRFGDAETHPALIDAFASIAFCDEAAAAQIARMPFLDDAGVGSYFQESDATILEGLGRVAQSRRGALSELLARPELQGGITDRLVATMVLLLLEQEDPAAAMAIRDLPWVADGIRYIDYDAQPAADHTEDETAHVHALVSLHERANGSFHVFLQMPWVRDGYQWTEIPIINELVGLAFWDDASAARIMQMPFLEALDGDEQATTALLMDIAVRRALPGVLSSPRLEGGIRDDQLAVLALADIEHQDPSAAAALNRLAWLEDGIDASEHEGVRSIVRVATGSDALFRALLTKEWVQDSLSRAEIKALRHLWFMASMPINGMQNEATTLQILDMPFMKEVTTLDALAVNALEVLMFSNEEGSLEKVLSQPQLRDGITDDWTHLVAVTTLADRVPGLLDVLLDPERTSFEKRVITLPLRGEVTLHVIEPQALGLSSPGSGALEPMDALEHAIRTHEEFMGLPFPERDVILFIANVFDAGGAHLGHGLLTSASRDHASTITHEAAHIWEVSPIWLARPSAWISEGAAQFLTAFSERARIGTPLPGARSSCSLANTISELVTLGLDPDVIYASACSYVLGESMFLELYRSLGDAAFRKGFSNLYLISTEQEGADDPRGECTGDAADLCYFKAAFLPVLTPEQAATAERIIDRRYFGR